MKVYAIISVRTDSVASDDVVVDGTIITNSEKYAIPVVRDVVASDDVVVDGTICKITSREKYAIPVVRDGVNFDGVIVAGMREVYAIVIVVDGAVCYCII